MRNWGGHLIIGLILLGLGSAPWIAAGQTPAPLPAPPATIHVLALGDVTWGRYVGQTVARQGDDFAYPLAGLAPDLRAADLGLANLEGPLVATPPPYVPTVADLEALPLIGDRRAAPALVAVGLTVLGLANNHSLDAGSAGLAETRRALVDAGALAVGAGPDPAAARAAQMRTIHGLRVAILARSAVASNQHREVIGQPDAEQPAGLDPASPADLATLATDLAAARRDADVVILLLHWGVEYTPAVQESQRRVAAVAAQAGVDLVVGAHSHVAAPVDVLGSRPTLVAWSLGNAVFDQQWRPDLRQGLALDAVFDRQGLISVAGRPLWRQGIQPRLVPPADAQGQALIARIRPASAAKLQAAVLQYTEGPSPAYTLYPALAYRRPDPPAAASVLATDLDGDGVAEAVTLQDGHLLVSQGLPGGRAGMVMWRSPPDWRIDAVTRVAPDQPDLAFTVWKPTAPTEIRAAALRDQIRQHFFLFGWRRGAIRPVWNSSALPNPFPAFAYAPLGPGGVNRLVALEGDYRTPGQAPALTVWGWNGFGYSLEWRGPLPPGAAQVWRAGAQVFVQYGADDGR